MIDDMHMRKLAEKTQSHYIRWVWRLTAFLGRSPDTATVEEVRRFQLHLVDSGSSPVSLNAAITALKFFFEVTLGQPHLTAKMQPVRVPHTLPVVLQCAAVVGRGFQPQSRLRRGASSPRQRQLGTPPKPFQS
jgi:hypothetical protein